MTQVLEEVDLTATTLDRHILPTQFLGRDSDLGSVEGLLHRDEARLITLVEHKES